MTIPEQMKIVVSELINSNGKGYRISSGEIKTLLHKRFGTNTGSIIPSDYCYNRVNKGIVFTKYPRLFAYVDRGIYECLGENYPYDGAVCAQPYGTKNEIVVGAWNDGKFSPNSNWEHCFMK